MVALPPPAPPPWHDVSHHAQPHRLPWTLLTLLVVAAASAGSFILGRRLWRQYMRHQRYLDLEAANAEEEARRRAEEEARRKAKKAAMDKARQDAAKTGKIDETAAKRDAAKRDAAERARENARKASERAQERAQARAAEREASLAEIEAAEREAARLAEEERLAALAAAAAREEAAKAYEEQRAAAAKRAARAAAQRLADYKAKMAAHEAELHRLNERPAELGQHCDIKPPVPTFTPLPANSLAPQPMRSRRMWLPSRGWGTDREGGESGKSWLRSWNTKAESSPLSNRSPSSRARTPTRGRAAASPQSNRASPTLSDGEASANTYPFAAKLHGSSSTQQAVAAAEEAPAKPSGVFGGLFGGGGGSKAAAEPKDAPAPASPPVTAASTASAAPTASSPAAKPPPKGSPKGAKAKVAAMAQAGWKQEKGVRQDSWTPPPNAP